MKNFKILLTSILILLTTSVINSQTTHVVETSNFEFTPADITIAPGDTVRWVWVQGTHTTTSDSTSGENSWSAPLDASNQSFSVVLTATGFHRYYCIPHGGPGGQGMAGTITVEPPTSIEDENKIPAEYKLGQNYPNPFNPETTIDYTIKEQGEVKLEIYNLTGIKVAEPVNRIQQPGNYEVTFDARKLSSGVYFYRLQVKDFISTKKMILMK